MSISRVYKIVNDVDDLIYIGSTTQILCKRMTKHRGSAREKKDRKLYVHMNKIGFEHFKILLIREYNNISKERLRYKEDKYINKFDTVNKGLNTNYANGLNCIHNMVRGYCKECKGKQICIHNNQKFQCLECKGHGICVHNKRKPSCKECNGSQICIHNKNRPCCIVCSPVTCDNCNKIYNKATIKRHQKSLKCINTNIQ